MYTSQADMFAVLFRLKGATEWGYINRSIIMQKNETRLEGLHPENYLCNDMDEAREVWKICVGRYKANLAEIKISRMNRYNLEREIEVMPGWYREFK